MSTLTFWSDSAPKMVGGDAGPVGHAAHRDFRLVTRVGDAGDVLFFHDFVLIHDQGAVGIVRWSVLEAGQHAHPHLLVHRQLDAAGLQDFSPDRGQFQHLLVGDLGQLAGLRDDARVGGIDAVHIGIDVAAVGLQRCRQRHGGGVRPAAPQRGDAAVGRDPLEARDHGDMALFHAVDQVLAVDVQDARLAVRVIGADRDLPALPGARLDPDLHQGDRQQAGGDLFAGGDNRVVFACVVQRRQRLAPGDELVGGAGHGRDHDGDLVPRVNLALDAGRDVADAVEVGDGGAAEFHHNTRHCSGSVANVEWSGDTYWRAAGGATMSSTRMVRPRWCVASKRERH